VVRPDAETDGKAIRIIPAKTSIAQANSGIRARVIPGARVFRMPTRISIAPAIALISMKPIPSSQKSALMPGEYVVLVSGGYMNQPPSGASPTKIEAKKHSPPTK
jgi:hypothetical protein